MHGGHGRHGGQMQGRQVGEDRQHGSRCGGQGAGVKTLDTLITCPLLLLSVGDESEMSHQSLDSIHGNYNKLIRFPKYRI